MNLYPCSSHELKCLGYKDSTNNALVPLVPANMGTGSSLATNLAIANASIANLGSSKDNNFSISTVSEEITPASNQQALETAQSSNPFSRSVVTRPRFPVPDITKMYPFKQNRNSFSGLQPVPGGGMFLFPSIIADMIKRIPPPSLFDVGFYIRKFKL